LRALRANRVFRADEKRIRAKDTVVGKSESGFLSAPDFCSPMTGVLNPGAIRFKRRNAGAFRR